MSGTERRWTNTGDGVRAYLAPKVGEPTQAADSRADYAHTRAMNPYSSY